MRYAAKSVRERKGWSLRVAAKHLATSHQHLDAVERGRVPLSTSLADRMARVYAVPHRSLVADTADAAVLARVAPFADLVDQATKTVTKSATVRKAFETELDDLIAEAEEAVRAGRVEAAVLRVLRVLRQSLNESDGLAAREDDGHGRRVVGKWGRREGEPAERDPITGRPPRRLDTERDGYGRPIRK